MYRGHFAQADGQSLPIGACLIRPFVSGRSCRLSPELKLGLQLDSKKLLLLAKYIVSLGMPHGSHIKVKEILIIYKGRNQSSALV